MNILQRSYRLRSYDYVFTFSRAGRMGPGDVADPEAGQSGRFGFWWFCWLPKFHGNGGRFRRREVVDVFVLWLCFRLNLTAWPRPTKTVHAQDRDS